MCGDHTNRESTGGAIAILKSIGSSPSAIQQQQNVLGELHFLDSSVDSTYVTFQSRSMQKSLQYTVMIHRNGDLTKPVEQAGCLHQFEVHQDARSVLEGSVANYQIVGRRVSMYENHLLDRRIAEGIIGWN